MLDVEAFQHRLADPVAIGELAEIIFQVAGRDELRRLRMHEGRRALLHHLRDGAFRKLVAVGGPGGNDIEQQHGDARVGDMGGDTAAHDAGAENGDLLDLAHQAAASRMVAMP